MAATGFMLKAWSTFRWPRMWRSGWWGGTKHDAGYIDNVHGTRTYPTSGVTIDNASAAKKNYNTVDKIGARAALEIDLDENWTITPTVTAQEENTKVSSPMTRPSAISGHALFIRNITQDRWYQAALTVQGKIGNLDLVYSGGYMNRCDPLPRRTTRIIRSGTTRCTAMAPISPTMPAM